MGKNVDPGLAQKQRYHLQREAFCAASVCPGSCRPGCQYRILIVRRKGEEKSMREEGGEMKRGRKETFVSFILIVWCSGNIHLLNSETNPVRWYLLALL